MTTDEPSSGLVWNARDDYPSSPVPQGRVEWVVEQLRDAILLGEMVPGEKILTTKISQSWNISPTPIREAIQRLASEGLLEIRSQRGARVAVFSPARAFEAYELRSILEPMLLRVSLERFHDDDRFRLSAAFDEYATAWHDQTVVTPEMSRVYLRLHDVLASRSPLTALTSIVRNLKLHSLRYSNWFTTDERLEVHGRLVEAVLAGDLDRAVEAVSDAIKPGMEWAVSQLPEDEPTTSLLTREHLQALRGLLARYP